MKSLKIVKLLLWFMVIGSGLLLAIYNLLVAATAAAGTSMISRGSLALLKKQDESLFYCFRALSIDGQYSYQECFVLINT